MDLADDVRELVDELLHRWWDALPPTALSDAERVYLRREQDGYRRRAHGVAANVRFLQANYDDLRSNPDVQAALDEAEGLSA